MGVLFSKSEDDICVMRPGIALIARRLFPAIFFIRLRQKILGAGTASLLLLILALTLCSQASAANSANGSTLYHGATYACYSCHLATPRLPQLNAADAPNVLDYAIANNFGGAMGAQAGLTASDRADIAAYFGTLLSTPTVAVPYHGSTAATALNLSLDASPLNALNAIVYSTPTNGTVANGTFITTNTSAQGSALNEATVVYTHTANSCSSDSFTYHATGAAGSSSTRTINITVTPPAAPTAAASTANNVAFNTLTTIPLTISNATGIVIDSGLSPANGTLSVSGTTVSYTSSSTTYNSQVTFTYHATGPCGGSSGSAVQVTMNITAPTPGTPAVTASAPYNPGPGTPAATAISLAGPVVNAVTGVTVTTAPTLGSYTVTGTTVNYIPAAGNLAADSFQYSTTGPGGNSAGSGTVTVNITPPGAPTITQPITVSVPYNAGGAAATTIPLAGYITGPVNNITVTSAPSLGTATVSGATSVNYTPAAADLTSTTFNFTATAPPGLPTGLTSAVATVTINITPPGAPTIQNKSVSTAFNTPVTFSMASSISGTYSSITTGAATAGGNASVSGANITYTPLNGFSGTDTFSYTVTAPGGASSSANVTVTVAALPTVANMNVAVPYNTATTFNLPVSGFTQITVMSAPSHGAAPTPAANSTSITYTPASGYTGTDSFSYTATGPGGISAAATVSIAVSTLPPAAGAAAMTVQLNTPATLDLAPFITGSAISGVSVAAAPGHGAVTVNGTKVTFTPVNNYFGADAFSYLAYGSGGTSAAAAVSVTVVGRPDPSKDPGVIALIGSQVETARRFSRAQISNFQARLETLHRSPGGAENNDAAADPAIGSGAEAGASRDAGADKRYFNSQNVTRQDNGRPAGAAYQPAASLSANSVPVPAAVAPRSVLATVVSAISTSSGGASQPDQAARFGNALMLATTAWQSSSLNLSSSTGKADGSSALPGGIDVWTGGGVKFGTRDQTAAGNDGIDFSTDGISVGADRRFGDQLALGIGFGYARDRTDIGNDGTSSKSKSYTIAAYGSYQPTGNTFIDGVVGYGSLDYRTDRYVAPMNDFARSRRSGDYLFGSLAAGYEHRMKGLLLSPYGRLDLATHRLHQGTETGAGLYALTYAGQNVPSVQLAAGMRAESSHETDFGWVSPRLRVEFQHDFKGEQQASVSYADQINGPSYVIPSSSDNRNSLVLGVGSDFVLRRGLTLSFDYQAQRSSGQERSQSLFFKLIKDLDGHGPSPSLLASSAFGAGSPGIRVDAGYLFDDNVSRAGSASDILMDSAYSLNLSKSMTVPLNEHTRLLLNGFLGGEKFRTYTGLGRIYAGGEAELQYRTAGEFGAPTFGLFGNATVEEYESDLRDGYRLSAGVSARKPVTDRISLFGALAKNVRNGRSAVFDTSDYSARLNLDYALVPKGTLYFTGEYRKGDIVSSGTHSLANVDIAEVFVRDDVFSRSQFYAYRADGKTVFLTIGWNLPLGQKDSVDLSWRRVRSTPSLKPSFATAETIRYIDNQFSILYLTSF
ncbi:MAG: hypothetical protein JWQ21_247 [Herminiimonas sp.]|nr:hypothetical protein [Herminiimonas sp.]